MKSILKRKECKIHAIFMSSKSRKTSDPHSLVFSFADEIDLEWSSKYFALPNKKILMVILLLWDKWFCIPLVFAIIFRHISIFISSIFSLYFFLH